MKYFGGCDVGSTYTKAVILDENGKMVANTTIKSKINSEQSAIAAMDEVLKQVGLKSSKELEYLIGTGYGRNKVPFADALNSSGERSSFTRQMAWESVLAPPPQNLTASIRYGPSS